MLCGSGRRQSRADPLVRGWPPGQPFRGSSKNFRTCVLSRLVARRAMPTGWQPATDWESAGRHARRILNRLRGVFDRAAGSLHLAIRWFLPQETFPSGIVCRSCEGASGPRARLTLEKPLSRMNLLRQVSAERHAVSLPRSVWLLGNFALPSRTLLLQNRAYAREQIVLEPGREGIQIWPDLLLQETAG